MDIEDYVLRFRTIACMGLRRVHVSHYTVAVLGIPGGLCCATLKLPGALLSASSHRSNSDVDTEISRSRRRMLFNFALWTILQIQLSLCKLPGYQTAYGLKPPIQPKILKCFTETSQSRPVMNALSQISRTW
jgi:hypothetical protein